MSSTISWWIFFQEARRDANPRSYIYYIFHEVLRIWDVYPESRIRILSIPDPHQRIKVFLPKKLFLSCRKYDLGCSSRIRIQIFTHPGSRIQGQKGTGSRIRIYNTAFMSSITQVLWFGCRRTGQWSRSWIWPSRMGRPSKSISMFPSETRPSLPGKNKFYGTFHLNCLFMVVLRPSNGRQVGVNIYLIFIRTG